MDTSIRVTLPQGTLEGCTGKDLDGETIYQFLSIPYAKPPIGDLRFKAPLPAETWSGVRDATKEGIKCYSMDEFTGKPVGSEDCLSLNVYTKSLEPEEKATSLKPVMVWIHGGAFIGGTGSPRMYGPDFLMTQDIVLVTFQYRIGMLGFLRLKDPSLEVYGNAGLKDQVMALKYVRDNIRYFGGDPDNVTIFGNSAGATSVSYHVLSPISSGLFHKAIAQSGSAIKGWDECVHNPVKIAQMLDENVTTEEQALKTFKNLPVDQLYELQRKYIANEEIGTINKQFGPVVEHPDSKNAFILKNPIDIITSEEYNQVPIIAGYNNMEGLLFDFFRLLNPKRIMTVDLAIPYFLNLKEGSQERKELENKIEEFYFANGDPDKNLRDLLGDVAFITPCYAIAVNHAKTSKYPVYLYKCTLDTPINCLKHKIKLSHVPGTCHFDEVSYMFQNIITAEILKPGTPEEKYIRRMVKLWANFAIYGNPTSEGLDFIWKPFTTNEHNFLDIGNSASAGVNPDKKRMDFWAKIHREYSGTNKFM